MADPSPHEEADSSVLGPGNIVSVRVPYVHEHAQLARPADCCLARCMSNQPIAVQVEDHLLVTSLRQTVIAQLKSNLAKGPLEHCACRKCSIAVWPKVPSDTARPPPPMIIPSRPTNTIVGIIHWASNAAVAPRQVRQFRRAEEGGQCRISQGSQHPGPTRAMPYGPP